MSAVRAPARVWRFGDDPEVVAAALARGAIVAVPTESSYGLAVDPRDTDAVAAIFALKGRSGAQALPVVGADVEQLVALGVDAHDPGLSWAAERWPAALSVIVALATPIAAASADGTLAVRVPAHDGLRRLLTALGRPLTATSANASGTAPLVDPRAAQAWLDARGADFLLIDGGALPGGAPSTLVAWRDGRPDIVRPGRVAIA